MDLSIVTVTWKSKNDIQRLIQSIHKYVSDIDYEIIVVDNNSQDGTVELLQNKFPDVTVIDNDYNAGYAGGMNQGYQIAEGEYIVFMNPDMELIDNSFIILLEKLNENHDIGIIAPKLQYEDNSLQPTVKRDPTLASQIPILFKVHHFIQTHSLRTYIAKDFDYTKEQEVDQLMGAFIMCRLSAVKDFGLWDEDYPLWWEDLQLCLDSRRSGYKNVYTPDTTIIHFEGKSFAQVMSVQKQRRFNKGMRIYFLKNHGIVPYLLLLLLHPISMVLAWISHILKIKPRTQSKL